MQKKPKTKLEEFAEKLNKAVSKEEIQSIVKKLETYTKLYPSEEGFILLANAYYMLGEFGKSLDILKPLSSNYAKYLRIIIFNATGQYKKAYNLIEELLNTGVPKEMQENLNIQKILIFTTIGNFQEASKLYTKQVKDKLLEDYPTLAMEIIPQIEGYIKAQKMIKKDKNIKIAYDILQTTINEKIPNSKIVPIVEKDPEYQTEELWIRIYLPEKTEKKLIDKIEDQIIEQIILKQDIDINYSFIEPREEEEEIVYS